MDPFTVFKHRDLEFLLIFYNFVSMKRILHILIAVFAVLPLVISCGSKEEKNQEEQPAEEVKEVKEVVVEEPKAPKEPTIIFGIVADGYTVENKVVKSGESWSTILDAYGISVKKVLTLEKKAKDICPLDQIRADKKYTAFTRQIDSTKVALEYIVYEKNKIDYAIFSFVGDSITVSEGHRDVKVRRVKKTATIKSSLWGAITEAKLPSALAVNMEDIYEYIIDFFSIREGDTFTVVYDEKYIDSVAIGVERIWAAKFTHRKKDFYAIPFKQDGKVQYWGKDGASLRKQFLQTPLKFTRISSGFTNARLHPVLKVYRPHHGIDYAAPVGTPVRAVADGTVIQKGYRGAAGNMIKIQHSSDLVSGYMHLSKFGKGIEQGTKVKQGEIIGYVGSTGRSTGAHLDYRLWKNGTPINPTNITQNPINPISKKDKGRFNAVRDLLIAELEGDVPDSMKVKTMR